jgi:hypothetical protein
MAARVQIPASPLETLEESTLRGVFHTIRKQGQKYREKCKKIVLLPSYYRVGKPAKISIFRLKKRAIFD